MSDDDGLMNEQTVFKEQLEKAHANFKKTPKDRITRDYVEIKINLLNDCWNKFTENHQKIANTYDKKVLADHVYTKEDLYFKCEEEYTMAKCAMMKKLRDLGPPVQVQLSEKQAETSVSKESIKICEVKIPTIKIPTFSGSYTEWCSFHDQFSSLIHNNEKLSSVQKLHYLKTNLNGEAATLLKNITITDSNYDHAWNKLLKRYQNKRIIVNAYLSKLFSIKTISTESANLIKNMLDITTDCLNGLKSLNIPTDSWDSIIIFMTISKLDTESIKQWEEKLGSHDELPTLEQLTDFLEARFRSLEGRQAVRNRATTSTTTTNNTTTKRTFHTTNEQCVYCDGDHYLYKCKDFSNLQHKDKLGVVTKNGLCFNCLIPKHRVTECRQRTNCKICRRRHHSLLHPEGDEQENTNETRQTTPDTPRPDHQLSAHFTKKIQSTGMLLATAIIGVKASDGSMQQLRALIDQGSEGSFITESAAQALGLRRYTVNSSVSGLGANTYTRIRHKVTFNIQSTINNSQFNVDAFCLKTLTKLLPSRRVSTTWPHIHGLPLADSRYSTPGNIDILLGAKIYSQILLEGVIKGPPGSPLAQNTQLGWILSGEVINYNEEHLYNDYEYKKQTYYENITDQYSERNTRQEKYYTRENEDTTEIHNRVLNLHIVNEQDNFLLQKFWEIDSDTTTKIMTDEEQQCEKHFNENYTRDDLGRYIVKIPMKIDSFDYGNTKQIALQRLNQLERKLNKDPALKEKYTKVIQEYIDLNHMEKIDKEKDTAINTFYLPHHAVIRDDKSTSKVRIVFNASSRGPNGKSLNDNMLVGPTIQQDLRQIVMRWRTHEIGFVADCVKFYRQVKVTEKCADYQRILWRTNGELNEYKLTRVTFGTACAPYLATRALHQLATDEEINFPIASAKTKLDYYIDDFLSGSDNLEESYEVYRQMTGLMKVGGFQIQKWASNNREFEDYVQTTCYNSENIITFKSDDIVKTLGLIWNKEIDSFQYTINLPDPTTSTTTVTKRTKLLRVTAYIMRVFSKEKHEKHLTGKEITSALTKCIILCQKQEFKDEIERLQSKKSVRNDSRLKTLNPFIDPQGILRVGGRLANAEIPDVTKHQVILPGHHPFTKLILIDTHKQTMHGGPMLMLSHLRTKYWITNAKTRLRQVVHRCVTCARHRASTGSQMMGSLPQVRVTPTRAFQHSGVDFAGPIDLRLSKGRGCKTQKGYLSVFVCMVTRAIHIEIVTSLTAIDFVAAFKRFVARRGRCSDMWSDNATNFIAGNKELNNQFETTMRQVQSEVENLLANDRTTWHHIPASGPHFGGLWEASVKLIKFHLKRVLGNTTLTYEEMSTVTAQIEACINSRPISHISDDPSDITPLTPGHFLIGEAPITVPEETYLQTNTNRLSRWQLTQRLLQDFWSRWSKEYLTNLQQRPKWLRELPNLQIGDLVIVKEDHLPPSKWVMARIIDTHPGGDNLIRVLTLKSQTSTFKRPVTKVSRLPIDI